MEANFNQMIKRPLRTMKTIYIVYLIVTILCAFCSIVLLVAKEPNYPFLAIVVVMCGITWGTRYGYNDLAKGTKRGWVISMVLSAHCLVTLLFPLGIYGLTGLLHRSVRSHYLDAGDENQSSASLS